MVKDQELKRWPYSTRTIVVTIVDENKAKEAVSVIKEAARTGTTGGGIVAVSSVDDLTII
jgi:nitrogen regulatory protein PII